MKTIIILFCIIPLGCSNTNTRNEKNNLTDTTTVKAVLKPTDTFYNRVSILDHYYFGSLQYLPEQDSLYNVRLCGSESYESPSFEVFFIPKFLSLSEIKTIDIQKYWSDHKNELDKYFFCVLFIYPMHDPDTMEDFHADNADYPCDVSVYILVNPNYKLGSKSKRINNLKELSAYKSSILTQLISMNKLKVEA